MAALIPNDSATTRTGCTYAAMTVPSSLPPKNIFVTEWINGCSKYTSRDYFSPAITSILLSDMNTTELNAKIIKSISIENGV